MPTLLPLSLVVHPGLDGARDKPHVALHSSVFSGGVGESPIE